MSSAQKIVAIVVVSLIHGAYAADEDRFRVIETGMETRDGVNLRTFVYLPLGEGPFPVLIYRTPYSAPFNTLGGYPRQENRGIAERPTDVGWPAITDEGYALVVQYTRGRTGSEGEDRAFTTDRDDGAALVAWIQRRPWSNGRIGVLGDSAYGITSLLLASAQPQGLTAAYAQVASGDLFDKSLLGPGGALDYEFTLPWLAEQAMNADEFHYWAVGYRGKEAVRVRGETRNLVEELLAAADAGQTSQSPIWRYLPLIEHPAVAPLLPVWRKILTAGYRSEWTREHNTAERISVPMLHVGMWYDVFNPAMMETFVRVDARTGSQRLIVMDGTHYDIDDPARWPIYPMIPWFDYWLKDDTGAIDSLPKISFEVSGSPGEWYSAESWPPAGMEPGIMYLHEDGSLNDSAPQVDDGFREYVYDPADPVPTVGGRNLYIPAGPLDQRSVEPPHRADVLLYLGAPRQEDLLIAGPLSLRLHVSSDRPDTDFTAKLIDRHPDGTATLVADGILRTRFREGGPEEVLMIPGEIYPITIELGHIAYRFRVGHQLQVDVSSSNFPRWDRNLNTGGPLYQNGHSMPANNRVHHDSGFTSAIVLPVIADTSVLQRVIWPSRN